MGPGASTDEPNLNSVTKKFLAQSRREDDGEYRLSYLENATLNRQSLQQIRRQIRERRQYIYAKSLEAQERQTYERKRKLKDALASGASGGKGLPTELKKDAKSLGKELLFDEAQDGEFSYTHKVFG